MQDEGFLRSVLEGFDYPQRQGRGCLWFGKVGQDV